MKRTRLAIGAFVIASIAVAAVAAVASGGWEASDPLPYYGSADLTPQWTETAHRVGAFRLTTQTGEAFDAAELVGRPYVASFIYTRCSVMCPTLVRQLTRVSEAVSDPRFLLVSFSVTPDLDTPDVLAAFGRSKHIEPTRWKLLTGSKQSVYALARDGFFATDERLRTLLDPVDALLHTERLTLVDATGRIRGVYNGSQAADVAHLIDDARALLRARGAAIGEMLH